MSTPAPSVTHPSRRFGPGRIIMIVFGSVAALIALGLIAAAATITWANATQRDDAGFFNTSFDRYSTQTYALTHEGVDLFTGTEADWITDPGRLATAKVRARADGRPLFVGIGPSDDVGRYLDDVAHDEVTDVHYRPFDPTYERREGGAPQGVPGDEPFWAASATGTDPELTWPIEEGEWSLVVMHEDGSAGVTGEVSLGAKVNFLGWISLGLLAAGLLVGAGAAALIVLAVRRPRAPGPGAPVAAPGEGAAGETTAAVERATGSPVVLEARLEPVSRWLWLVKWVLVIPHAVVLVFLWAAFVVLTVIAGFAILFTGRYPKDIFEFNLGVLRWTWRVAYYSYAALGTDRYPPFTLADVPGYPARLDIAPPEQLSRGLVLVKWWLLALPHLLILGILLGGYDVPFARAGLISLLVIIAGFALLFTTRYPDGLFAFVIGLNRWVVRVAAYVALMTDRYPPFRLDQGGSEPQPPAE